MRLDKYLKLTRLIKRREVASVLIKEGSILVNKKNVKPSYQIKINDIVQLTLGRRCLVIRINDIKEIVNKKNANELYMIINDSLTTK